MRCDRIMLLATGLSLMLSTAQAVGEDGSIYNLGLQDLLDLKVNLASKSDQSVEEAPSLVSVITRRDIEAYGARDVSDVLRLVPGLEFGLDVSGLVGLGARGIWVHEGKILVMLNGVMVNDLAYGNVNYFGTFPAAMIERVEVIRGPGSALYGGFAEAGVINIVTRKASTLNGLRAQGSFGAMGSSITHGGNLSFGVSAQDLEMAVHLGASSTPLSDRGYQDFFGGQVPAGFEFSARRWSHVVTEAKYKEALSIRFHKFRLAQIGQDGFTQSVPLSNGRPTEEALYEGLGVNVEYEANLSSQFSFKPSFEFISGPPINAANLPTAADFSVYSAASMSLRRYKGELAMSYGQHASGQIDAGVGYIRDEFDAMTAAGAPGLKLSPTDFGYRAFTQSAFAYGQYSRQLGKYGLTLGSRLERTAFGNAIAPRAGLTFSDGPLSSKLLYGRAYRIPLAGQKFTLLFPSRDLIPETSNTLEAEIGYRLAKNLKVTGNAFYTQISQPITFLGADGYANFGQVQTYGWEGGLDYREQSFGGFLNFSQHTHGGGTSDNYLTEDRRHMLGMPSLKVNLGAYKALSDFQVAPSFTFLSKRYFQSAASAQSSPTVAGTSSLDPILLTNLSLRWKNVFPNSTLSLTGQNIFNAGYSVVQPYYGKHAPLAAQDREVRLEFETGF